MVAGPLVQGARTAHVAVAAAAHTAALLVGSAVTASVLLAIAHLVGPLPPVAVATTCLAAAAAIAAQTRMPGSRWMVPREWARFGTTRYAAAFGFALGTGVMTLLPSAGFYAVLAAAEASAAWWQVYAVMLAFGVARAAMVPLLTARSALRGGHPVAGMDRLRDTMARLGVVEIALLTALAMELLHR